MELIFYNLFLRLKNQTVIPLSVDQYMDFVKTFAQMPEESFENLDELKQFTKLFWLENTLDTKVYDDLFEQEVEKVWKKLWEKRFEKKEIVKEDKIRKTEDGERETEKQVTELENKPIEMEDKPIDIEDTDYKDLELIIGEEDEKAYTSDNPLVDYVLSEPFQLSDQQIMPFSPRFLSQRTRRLTQREEVEISDEIDMPAIIKRFAQDGFIADVLYLRKVHKRSNIVFLADRFGSMLSYEFLEKQLARSFRMIPKTQFEHYFFYNIPQKDREGRFQLRTQKKGTLAVDAQNHKWNANTYFFIFSDAGGHSGMVNKGRLIATLDFWHFLKNIAPHNVFWINPVPKDQMNDCTARRLQISIPMIYPAEEQFNRFFTDKRYAKS